MTLFLRPHKLLMSSFDGMQQQHANQTHTHSLPYYILLLNRYNLNMPSSDTDMFIV